MKKAKQYLGLFLLAGLILAISNPKVSAQNKHKKGACTFLTEEQQKQATEIKAKYHKDLNYLHNKLNELHAKEKTLIQVDNPSLKQLYSNIEAKTEIHNKIAKTKAKMHIELRNIMTEEQRLMLGSGMGKKMMCQKAMKKHQMCGSKHGKHHMHKGCSGDCSSCKGVKGKSHCNTHAHKGMHKKGDCNCDTHAHKGMHPKGDCHKKGHIRKGKCCGSACKMNFTEEQEAEFKKLKVEKLKVVNPLKNKLNELRAKKQTLMSANKINNRDVNKIIDQMTNIKEDIAKANMKYKVAKTKLLTEEQKMMLNKRMQHKKYHRR